MLQHKTRSHRWIGPSAWAAAAVLVSSNAWAQSSDTALDAKARANNAINNANTAPASDGAAATAGGSDANRRFFDETITPSYGSSSGSPQGVSGGLGFGGATQISGDINLGPDTYVVREGDTLWSISQQFFGTPWYWPKLWAINPELANPNWIEPGTIIRLSIGATTEKTTFTEVTVKRPISSGYGARFANLNSLRLQNDFFISNEDLKVSGKIGNSHDEHHMLSYGDNVFFKLDKEPDIGQSFYVYRVVRDVKHPVTGVPIGRVVRNLGEIVVEGNAEDKTSIGRITRSFDAIERNDILLASDLETDREVVFQKNETNVRGYILDEVTDLTTMASENQRVFIDKGKRDGVKQGNIFSIVRAGDPITAEVVGLPDEYIGRIVVVDVKEDSCTGVIVQADREINRGDRVEMLVN